MIHDNYSCSLTFEPLIDILKSKYRVIAPCLRGFGYSSYKKTVSSIQELAEDLMLFI